MSLICRVVIGHFDAAAACGQRTITPTKPLNEEQVAHLQAACDEAFGIQLRLAPHLTRDGLLCIQDGTVRPDTYKAAAVAHGLFGMSAIHHAHRCVLFPAKEEPLPEPEQLIAAYQSLRLDMDEQQRRQKAEECIRRMHDHRAFERAVEERVRSFVTEWRGRAGPSAIGTSPPVV